MILRRTLLTGGTGIAAFGARSAKVQLGVTDWNLQQAGKVEAVALAKRLGFDGIQVSLGQKPVDGHLPLGNSDLQARYVAAARQQDIVVNSTCLDILHVNYLKNDPLAVKWVAESLSITRNLNASIVLLPFFGDGALTNVTEMDYVADALREVGLEAERARVILGIENTVSARDNLRIIERSRSRAVQVYYDVGNSTNNGFDVGREIAFLGNKQICQFHFKDNPHYLGQGRVDWNGVMHAIADIGYRGWANLETDSPSRSLEADLKRNLIFARKLLVSSGL